MILDFAVGMKDQVSRSSKDAAKAVLGVSAAMQATQARAKSLESELGKARDELTKLMSPSARGKELVAQLDEARARLTELSKPSMTQANVAKAFESAGSSVKQLSASVAEGQKQVKSLEAGISRSLAQAAKAKSSGDAKGWSEASATAQEYAAALKTVRASLDLDRSGLAAAQTAYAGLEKQVRGFEAEQAMAVAHQKELVAGIQASIKANSAAQAEAVTKQRGVIAGIQKDIASNKVAGKEASEVQGTALEQLQGKWEANAKASESFGSQLKSVGAVAGGVAAAIAAVTLSLGGLVVMGAKFAVEASEAHQQALTLFDAMGEGKISGQQVDSMLDGLQQKLGIAKDAMIPLTTEIMKMGVTSQDAVSSMTQAALAAKALSGGADSGSQAFLEFSQKVQAAAETTNRIKLPAKALGTTFAEMGLNVTDVAKSMGIGAQALAAGLKAGTIQADKLGAAVQDALVAKGAGPLEEMSLSAQNLGALLKQYVVDVFQDMMPVVRPFFAQVRDLFGILDSKTKPSGQALKAGIEGVFKRVFEIGTKLIPVIKHFFLQMIVYGLQAYIALRPVLKWFEDLKKNQKFMETMQRVLAAVGTALKVVGVVILVATASAVAFGVALTAVQAGILALGALIMADVTKWIGIIAGWAASGASAAADFVKGLVMGVVNGAGAVGDAVKGLATKAKDTFKNMLGIHSPSTVGKQLGGHFGGGIAGGVQGAAPQVHAASKQLGSATVAGTTSAMASAAAPSAPQTFPTSPALGKAASAGPTSQAAPQAPPQASSGGGVTVNVQPGAIAVTGGSGEGALELTETAVAAMFERLALSSGLG